MHMGRFESLLKFQLRSSRGWGTKCTAMRMVSKEYSFDTLEKVSSPERNKGNLLKNDKPRSQGSNLRMPFGEMVV